MNQPILEKLLKNKFITKKYSKLLEIFKDNYNIEEIFQKYDKIIKSLKQEEEKANDEFEKFYQSNEYIPKYNTFFESDNLDLYIEKNDEYYESVNNDINITRSKSKIKEFKLNFNDIDEYFLNSNSKNLFYKGFLINLKKKKKR
jgi:hypothetical protein